MTMDDATLKAAFAAHTDGATKFTRRMAIKMADMADTTPRRLVLRLEGLGLLRRGSWDWFVANGGITTSQIDEVRGQSPAGSEIASYDIQPGSPQFDGGAAYEAYGTAKESPPHDR